MKVLDSLLSNLSCFGVYSFLEGTNNYAELMALSAGLELAENTVEELLRENFYTTAETYGLELAEGSLGKIRDKVSTGNRREMLVARGRLSPCDFTLCGVKNILKALGVSGRISENPGGGKLTVYVGDEGFSQGEKDFIRNQLRDLLPAQIDSEVFFSLMNWQSIEESPLMFSQIEEKNYTWEYIDSM